MGLFALKELRCQGEAEHVKKLQCNAAMLSKKCRRALGMHKRRPDCAWLLIGRWKWRFCHRFKGRCPGIRLAYRLLLSWI